MVSSNSQTTLEQSPVQVLTELNISWHQWLYDNWYFQVDKPLRPVESFIILTQLRLSNEYDICMFIPVYTHVLLLGRWLDKISKTNSTVREQARPGACMHVCGTLSINNPTKIGISPSQHNSYHHLPLTTTDMEYLTSKKLSSLHSGQKQEILSLAFWKFWVL